MCFKLNCTLGSATAFKQNVASRVLVCFAGEAELFPATLACVMVKSLR